MRVLVPTRDGAMWQLQAVGETDGYRDDVTVVLADEQGRTLVTVRTLLRTGARLAADDVVVSQASDEIATARMAIESLMLSLLPTADSRDEARAAVRRVLDEAAVRAAERDAWEVSPLHVEGRTYALWHRRLPEGVVAHADVGWATVALWSTGALPEFEWSIEELSDTADVRIRPPRDGFPS